MTALAALGIRNYSPRFIDVLGDGKIEHVTELSKEKIDKLKQMHAEYGVRVTSIGARVGKVKLLNVDDGSHNRFVPLWTTRPLTVHRYEPWEEEKKTGQIPQTAVNRAASTTC